jgi:hypothetical protein
VRATGFGSCAAHRALRESKAGVMAIRILVFRNLRNGCDLTRFARRGTS